jgi:hypothetical protein
MRADRFAVPGESTMNYSKPLALTLALAVTAPTFAQFSPEEQAAIGWYRHYLRRNPEPAGLVQVVNELRAGATPQQIQGRILGSDEYLINRAGGQLPTFVAGVFIDGLRRQPTAQEVTFWLQQMRTGALNEREAVATAILGGGLGGIAAPPVVQAPIVVAPQQQNVFVQPQPQVIAGYPLPGATGPTVITPSGRFRSYQGGFQPAQVGVPIGPVYQNRRGIIPGR